MNLELINLLLLALNLLFYISTTLYIRSVKEWADKIESWYKSIKDCNDAMESVYRTIMKCHNTDNKRMDYISSQYETIYDFWKEFSKAYKSKGEENVSNT